MQITLKTLQQNTFKVEIYPSKTVGELKKKIETDKGDAFPAEGQKLIYAGKILGMLEHALKGGFSRNTCE